MRLARLIILIAAGSLVAGAVEARVKARHRHPPRHIARVTAQPAHGMSALARIHASEQRRRELRQLAAASRGGPELRFGTFKRDYSLNVTRPAIRPDQDGAVGLSLHMKTHD